MAGLLRSARGKWQKNLIGFSMAMGIILGVVTGPSTDNVGLWITIGIAVGAAAGGVMAKRESNG